MTWSNKVVIMSAGIKYHFTMDTATQYFLIVFSVGIYNVKGHHLQQAGHNSQSYKLWPGQWGDV